MFFRLVGFYAAQQSGKQILQGIRYSSYNNNVSHPMFRWWRAIIGFYLSIYSLFLILYLILTHFHCHCFYYLHYFSIDLPSTYIVLIFPISFLSMLLTCMYYVFCALFVSSFAFSALYLILLLLLKSVLLSFWTISKSNWLVSCEHNRFFGFFHFFLLASKMFVLSFPFAPLYSVITYIFLNWCYSLW